jgi:hypothetical protein
MFPIFSANKQRKFLQPYCALDLCWPIKNFHDHHFTDELLPIAKEKTKGGCWEGGNEGCSHTACKNTFSNWPFDDIHDFYETQWQFLAPVFTKEKYRHDLHRDCPLPCISKGAMVKDSHFSLVYEVEVHDDHQCVIRVVRFTKATNRRCFVDEKQKNGRTPRVAIKELKDLSSDTPTAFETEAIALDEINRIKHPNLISESRIHKGQQILHHVSMC